MGLVAALVVVGAMVWPDQYRAPAPWGQSVFFAVLWSSILITACRPLLGRWKFWVALAAGLAVQVWATKSLLVNGLTSYSRKGKGMAVVGMLVWGLSYRLLTWTSRSLGLERSKTAREDGPEV